VAAATRYARSDGLHIAYQVQGAGSLDLVFMPHWASHVELLGDRDDDEDDDTDDGQGPELPCQPAPVRASKRRVRADLVGHGGRR
jgi:hypothetical protein